MPDGLSSHARSWLQRTLPGLPLYGGRAVCHRKYARGIGYCLKAQAHRTDGPCMPPDICGNVSVSLQWSAKFLLIAYSSSVVLPIVLKKFQVSVNRRNAQITQMSRITRITAPLKGAVIRAGINLSVSPTRLMSQQGNPVESDHQWPLLLSPVYASGQR